METVSPNIFVKDIKKTIDFYKFLGFEVIATVPEEGELIFTMMKCGSVTFLFQTFASLGDDLPQISRQDGGSIMLYIQTKGIRDLYNRIKGEVRLIKELEKTFYGATEFTILDINNYVITFAEDE